MADTERLAHYHEVQAVLLEKGTGAGRPRWPDNLYHLFVTGERRVEQIKNFLQTASEFEPADIGGICDTVVAAGGGVSNASTWYVATFAGADGMMDFLLLSCKPNCIDDRVE